MFGVSVGFGTAWFLLEAAAIKHSRSALFGASTALRTQGILYAASVPLSVLLVKAMDYRRTESDYGAVSAVAVAASTELLLASVALVWMPNTFFGGWKSGITKCCAFVMWTSGCRLVYALYLDEKRGRKSKAKKE